jgi:hypothetical protein
MWLTGWKYRKKITIQGSSGAGTNYQVLLKIGESSGTTGTDFHLHGLADNFPSDKNQSGDLRFTSSNGSTLLDFWVEQVAGTSPNRIAYVWVEVSEDLGTNRDIYCYFGNVNATNASDPINTFLYFTDFDGTTLPSGWTTSGSVNYSVSNGNLTVSRAGTNTGGNVFYNTNSFLYKAVRFRGQIDIGTSGTYGYSTVGFTTGDGGGGYPNRFLSLSTSASVAYYRFSGRDGSTAWDVLTDVSYNTLGVWDILWTSGEARLYFNGVLKATNTTNIPSTSIYIGMWIQSNGGTSLTDWILVRNYVSSEPTFLNAGPLEFLGSRRRLLISSY